MPTTLETLPDELLSIVIEELAKRELPCWPFTSSNKANSADPQKTLKGLALTSNRMSRLCKPHLYTVNKENPSPGYNVQPGSWIWIDGSLASTTLPRTELLQLQARIRTVANAQAVAEVIRENAKLQHICVDLTRLVLDTGNEAAFFDQLYCDDHAQADPKSLRSLHLCISRFSDAGWESFIDFLDRAKVQDLTLMVGGGSYGSLTASELAAVKSLRRLYLGMGGTRWLVEEMEYGPGLAEADHISELWLPECLPVGTVGTVDDVGTLLDALPRQLRRLVLCCSGNEIVEYLIKEYDVDDEDSLFHKRSHYPSIHLLAETAGWEHDSSTKYTKLDLSDVNPEILASELHARLAARNATITPSNWYAEMSEQWLYDCQRYRRCWTDSQVTGAAARS